MLELRVDPFLRGVAAIAIALQSVAGICGPACGSPGVNVAPATVTDGTIAVRKGDREAELAVTQGWNAEPGLATFVATVGGETEDGSNGALAFLSDDYQRTTGYFRIELFRQADNEDGFSISIFTSDPRTWSVGEVSSETIAATVSVISYEACTEDGCTFCLADVPDASVRFWVEQAGGSVDDSQNKVSDNFHRELRMEIDLGGPILGEPDQHGGSCTESVEAAGSVSFKWTSDDFVWTDCF